MRFKNKFTAFAILSIASLCACLTSHAQGRIHTQANVNQGQFIDCGGTVTIPTDSLGVSDTTIYIIPVTHTNELFPYLTWEWTKVGSGTATVVLTVTQSNDAVNYNPVLKGQAQTAYTKSYTWSATTNGEVEFWRDTAVVSARYLKLQWISSNTASVKGKLHSRVKSNIQ